MKVSEILRNKHDQVVTISGRRSIAELVTLLEEHRIGAVVVCDEPQVVAGIISERDVVRHLARDGAALLERPVSEVMTSTVHTCTPEEDLAALAEQMTTRRIRHVPVLDPQSRLIAIISIGDVVKSRMDQLATERDQLEAYVQQ